MRKINPADWFQKLHPASPVFLISYLCSKKKLNLVVCFLFLNGIDQYIFFEGCLPYFR